MSALSIAPRGLTWAVFRLHRVSLLFFAGCFLAFVGFEFYVYGVGLDALREDGPCGTARTPCFVGPGVFSRDYYDLLSLSEAVLAYLPLVLAAYVGGAVIARELESGTAALAWTQSVTPLRWLAAKLAWPALLTTVGLTSLLLLHRWIRAEAGDAGRGWYAADVFRSTGPAGVAWALCALAVGALCALLLKRTLPALGAAFAAMVAVNWISNRRRLDLWPTFSRYETTYHPIGDSSIQLDNRSWDAAGNQVEWMARGSVRHYREWHPESHFWPIQWVETGIVLTLTAALTATAFWLLKRRTP